MLQESGKNKQNRAMKYISFFQLVNHCCSGAVGFFLLFHFFFNSKHLHNMTINSSKQVFNLHP